MGKYFFKFLTFFLLCIPVQSFCQDTIVFRYNKSTSNLVIEFPEKNVYGIWRDEYSRQLLDFLKKSEELMGTPDEEYDQINKNSKENFTIPKAGWFDTINDSVIEKLEIVLFSDHSKRIKSKVERNDAPTDILTQTSYSTVKYAPKSKTSKLFDLQWLYIFIVLLVIALIVTMVIFMRRKNKRMSDVKKIRTGDSQLEVVEVVTNNSKEGLDDIKKDVEGYYVMNMDEDYKETAVKKIYLHHTAVKKMYDFFKKSIENNDQTMETGCYFIGCWERTGDRQYNISVEDIVEPGKDIEPGEFSFNFGVEIGVKLFSKLTAVTEKTGRNFVHTVWMHSHPGLGLFLSSHDLLVQRQLTYTEEPNRLVAFVIDTNTPDWQLAVFTAKRDGTMNNKADNPHIYSLDELYQWSRSAHTKLQNSTSNVMSEHIPDTKDGYHAVQINHQGSEKTFSVYFGGKAINQIDDIIYKSVGGGAASAFVEGECDANGNFTIEDFSEQENENSIGILVIDGESEYDDIVSQYADNEKLGILLICRSDEEIWIVARRDRDRQFVGETEHGVCSMRPMKEWLRRRRKPC